VKKIFLFAFCTCLLLACGKDYTYEGYKTLPKKEWIVDSVASFPFKITEQTKFYTLSYTIRNTLRYPYYNIFVNYELLDASGKVLLSKQMDNNLLNPKTGEPYGTGLGDMYDHDFLLLENYHFPTAGDYTLKLKQQMRLDTLPEIVAVGVKIMEKK
jgi:gliding motility-associated lipoprotein GldH